MVGRREFGVLGLTAAAALALKNTALAAEEPASDEDEHAAHHTYFDTCAAACNACQLICDSCTDHCARQLVAGNKEHHRTLRTCQDCADVCSTAARIMGRKGVFSRDICTVCAEVCKKCGDACEKFKDDEHMAKCAKECRVCEKACREMLMHK